MVIINHLVQISLNKRFIGPHARNCASLGLLITRSYSEEVMLLDLTPSS